MLRRVVSRAALTAVAILIVACEEVSGPAGESALVEPETALPAKGGVSEAFDAEAAAALGEGLVVWESNRTGKWRIWTRSLDGSGLRQLSRNEPGRWHCCAQISPDGERVAYLSLAGRGREYPGPTDTGVLRLIGVDGSGGRDLVEAARTAHESRAVVWHDASNLAYLTADGRTARLDVDGGESEILVEAPSAEFGWLVNSKATHATLGLPSFSLFDSDRRDVTEKPTATGCQAYFTHDGRWGFWTAGAGGPIHRMDLATRQVTTLLRKNDPLLPADRGYAYFPMTSDDGRIFAVAASAGRHDHFRADYEIFLFETDPDSLEVAGPAVRFTFDPAVDRFPDVWAEPLALGDHAGEAPFEVRLDAGRGDWAWDLGDGTAATGPTVVHRYEAAGVFRVSATADTESRLGRVRVAPAAPPRVVRAELREGGRRVVVWLDEVIAGEGVEARFDSGRAVEGVAVAGDGRSVVIDLADAAEVADRLTLTGVTDRAQRPNPAAALSIAVDPPLWPSNEADLVFLWQSAAAANLVRDRAAGVDRSPTIRSEDRATFDHAFAMRLAGGTFAVDTESSGLLVDGLRGANELTLEMTLTLEEAAGTEQRRIVTLGGSRPKELTLERRGNQLLFRIRSRKHGTREWGAAVAVFDIEPGRPTHIAVSYGPGELRAYRDGVLQLESQDVQGDFYHWGAGPLVFGGDWRGSIEGVAVYGRIVEPDEIAENAMRYGKLRADRATVERSVVEATRLGSAERPRLADISPYREALVVADYRIDRVVDGELDAGRIQVAEWTVLGGAELPAPSGRVTLTLERFADNPQLEGVVLGGTPAEGSELYYAVP